MVCEVEKKDVKINGLFSSNFFSNAKNFFNSNYNLALICAIVVLFWSLNIGFVSVPLLTIDFILVLFFCNDNPKAILLPILSISLMFNSLTDHMTIVVASVAVAVVAICAFICCKIFIDKVKIIKGKLFWPYLLVLLANALAGIIGHFELKAFLITLAFGVLLYFLYWFSINFLHNYQTYFAWCFIFLSFIIAGELFVAYIKTSDIFLAFQTKSIRIGAGEINSHALFLVSGIISSYYLATRATLTKKRVLLVLLALFQDVVLFFTFSRLSLVAGAIVNVLFLIILFKKSQNKKVLLIIFASVVLFFLMICLIFIKKISGVLGFYLNQGFSLNGREELWVWCINLFKQNPIFGFGFITRDLSIIEGSTLNAHATSTYAQIMAHNTILHYLVCTGIVGLILNIPFYIKKFKILCQKPFARNIFCFINVLAFELVSLLDASCSNLFNIILVFLILGLCEKRNQEYENFQIDKKIVADDKLVVDDKVVESKKPIANKQSVTNKNFVKDEAFNTNEKTVVEKKK